jgi:ABC-type antimicrobial peptide transport system permease subunit
MAQELQHDPALAPPAEAIHMPEPSYLPIVFAFGATVALVGILMGIVVSIIGLLILLTALIRWIREARTEMSELPLDHSH